MTSVNDFDAFLDARLNDDEAALRKAAELCGCHLPAPSWAFDDEETDGRILVSGEPHPELKRRLGRRWNGSYDGLFAAQHIVRHDPARVLREVNAKRRLLDEHPNVNDGSCGTCVTPQWGYPTRGGSSPQAYPCTTLRLLALSYADHPDYQECWRP